MSQPSPNISTDLAVADLPVIRQLDESAVNRIAAGEVVERPASAVKELVENALDAGATRIEVTIADGGKSLIRVTDDGHGIAADQLALALSRHATSKIDGSDLLNIHSFGFRGEALPSLAAVGRLVITTRARGSAEAAMIRSYGGHTDPVRPAALTRGTVVDLRDLFHATPARLKFLRSDRSETLAVSDTIKRLAMAAPWCGFVLRDAAGGGEGRVLFRADPETGDLFDALQARLATVLGRDFTDNAMRIEAERDSHRLTGFAALPTWSRGTSVAQFLFVNGRPVRDKLFVGALRAAYSDFLSRDRHPAAALFLDLPPTLVDVNVHPAKSEVRFRDPGTARGLIITALRHALAGAGHRASSTVAEATLGAFRLEPASNSLGSARIYQMDRPSQGVLAQAHQAQAPGLAEIGAAWSGYVSGRVEDTDDTALDHPLGAARAQVHENYIIAQTRTGMVIVDQHAAHERLVYERLKAQMAVAGVPSQALLIPEIVTLSDSDATRLLDAADELVRLGLVIEPFGPGALAVRETPAALGVVNAAALLRDIVDELADDGQSRSVQARLDAILSRMACHGSIRSGRRMQAAEMNALLREMEATPHSGQCNHGRPTYVELRLTDIERLFGRRT